MRRAGYSQSLDRSLHAVLVYYFVLHIPLIFSLPVAEPTRRVKGMLPGQNNLILSRYFDVPWCDVVSSPTLRRASSVVKRKLRHTLSYPLQLLGNERRTSARSGGADAWQDALAGDGSARDWS